MSKKSKTLAETPVRDLVDQLAVSIASNDQTEGLPVLLEIATRALEDIGRVAGALESIAHSLGDLASPNRVVMTSEQGRTR